MDNSSCGVVKLELRILLSVLTFTFTAMLYVGVRVPVHGCLGLQSVVPLQGNQMAQVVKHASVYATAVDPGHAAADLNKDRHVSRQSLSDILF